MRVIHEKREESGFELLEPLHGQLATCKIVEVVILLHVGGPIEFTEAGEFLLQAYRFAEHDDADLLDELFVLAFCLRWCGRCLLHCEIPGFRVAYAWWEGGAEIRQDIDFGGEIILDRLRTVTRICVYLCSSVADRFFGACSLVLKTLMATYEHRSNPATRRRPDFTSASRSSETAVASSFSTKAICS